MIISIPKYIRVFIHLDFIVMTKVVKYQVVLCMAQAKEYVSAYELFKVILSLVMAAPLITS